MPIEDPRTEEQDCARSGSGCDLDLRKSWTNYRESLEQRLPIRRAPIGQKQRGPSIPTMLGYWLGLLKKRACAHIVMGRVISSQIH